MPDMHDDDEFLRSIPAFLRRYQEPPPRKLPIRPHDLPRIRSQAKSRPAPIAAPAPVASSAPASPAPATPKPAAAKSPAAQRARIALAFENHDVAEGKDIAEGRAPAPGNDREDITFKVTLSRDVARQICMLAVAQDTTQRAVVLHALRLAGLSVPEDSDSARPRPPRPRPPAPGPILTFFGNQLAAPRRAPVIWCATRRA